MSIETEQIKNIIPQNKWATYICPECGCRLQPEGGCALCLDCGYSKCG